MQRWLKQNFTSVAGHVAQVPPAWIGIKFEQVPITDGAVIGIHVWRWFPGAPVHPAVPVLTSGINFSVKVEETDNGWIFHTAEDHFLQGTISFSVEQLASGRISFQIGLEGNHASRIHEQLFQWFGRRMEALTWNRLTGIVREECSRPQ